jgi:hypothetical protein
VASGAAVAGGADASLPGPGAYGVAAAAAAVAGAAPAWTMGVRPKENSQGVPHSLASLLKQKERHRLVLHDKLWDYRASWYMTGVVFVSPGCLFQVTQQQQHPHLATTTPQIPQLQQRQHGP